MAVCYSKTGRTVEQDKQNQWDGFLKEVKLCKKCGRPSMLHDVCPDCGGQMYSPYQHNFKAHVTTHLSSAAVLLVAQILLLFSMGAVPPGERVMTVVLSVVLFGLGAFCLYKAVSSYEDEGWRLISLKERYLFNKDDSEEVTAADLPRWLPYLDRARDAYYLDLAWLEQEAEQLPQNDLEERDVLLGRAVWLSMICDTPRLASVRYTLLCKGQICEGDDTDFAAIMGQLLPMERDQWIELLDQPRGVQTLCDCLQFDMLGLEPGLLSECLEWLMVRMNYNDLFESGEELTAGLRTRIIQTVAYYGPDACGESMKGYISRAGIFDKLVKMNPRFRNHPQFKGMRTTSGRASV